MAIKQKHNVIRIKNPSSGEWEPILSLKDSYADPLVMGAMPLIEGPDGTFYKLGIDENGIYAIEATHGVKEVGLQLTNQDTGVYMEADGNTYGIYGVEVADPDKDDIYDFTII